MKTSLLLLVSAVALSSCVGPELPPPVIGMPAPAPAPLPPEPLYDPHHHSDYHRDESQEYRNGYEIGRTDSSYGYPRDARRAYIRYGHGYESYFQEGYADGYDGRRLQH